MTKKRIEPKVLNDFNEIVAHMQENKAKREKEFLILLSILGTALGICIVLLYISLTKGI